MFLCRILLIAAYGTIVLILLEKHLVCGQVCQLTTPLQQQLDGLGVTVPCDAVFEPVNCDFEKIPLLTVEDYERCGPLKLNQTARNYLLGAAGRRITYNENKAAFKRKRIIPKMLRDVSNFSLEISTLEQKLSFPLGLSPVALQNVFHPKGEVATVRGMKDMGIVMILSSYSTTTIEEVADQAKGGSSHLWMQTFIFPNRSITKDIVFRAEKAGYEGIVVTIDSPINGTITCDAKKGVANVKLANFEGTRRDNVFFDKSLTFEDLSWMKSITNLPIIAKGVLSPEDARSAVRAGASAIFVSNQGGRILDSEPATIDILREIVDAVHSLDKDMDVYVDSGLRNGWDMFKALASGAKMAFIGSPQIHGLAMEGEDGVRNVLNILKREFEEAMLLSGAKNPSNISRNAIMPSSNC